MGMGDSDPLFRPPFYDLARDLARAILEPMLTKLREDPEGFIRDARARERDRCRARGSKGWRRHKRRHKARMRAAALAAVLSLLPAAAFSHTAPAGWEYDLDCCSTTDCAPVPADAIHETQGGYSVTIQPGMHPMVPAGVKPVTGFVPHGDRRIRASGDEHRHACVGKGGYIFCLYVQPSGF